MRARDLRWLKACANNETDVNDGEQWYRVLAFMGLSIPTCPADLLELANADGDLP